MVIGSSANTSSYVTTNWNRPASAPQVYIQQPQMVIQNSNQDTTYRATNWNTPVSPSQTYTQQPQMVINSGGGGSAYTMTNWNTPVSAGQYYTNNQVYAQQCATNYTLQNGTCVQTQKQCQNGTTVSVASTCYKTCPNVPGQIPESQPCPNQTQVCANGSIIQTSQTCPAETKTCSNGSVVGKYDKCTRVCPGGAIVGEMEYCPQNTKTCLSGKVISSSESCTRLCPNGQTVLETQSCQSYVEDNVYTLRTTEASSNSCRCNATSYISSGKTSLGYFEYGSSKSLGSKTVESRISQSGFGGVSTGDFSSKLTSLSSDAVYYCRAVLVNDTGTYKGDIASCNTLSSDTKKVTLTSKINSTKVKSTSSSKTSTKTKTSSGVICKDSNGNSQSITDTDNIMKIEINKYGDLTPGQIVEYRVAYKNDSKLRLENVSVKISLPNQLEYLGNSKDIKNDEVVSDIGEVEAGESGVKIFKFKVKDSVLPGSAIAISSSVYYEMYDESGNVVTDENSASDVSSILQKPSTQNTGDNIQSSNGQVETWGSLLLKWLLIIILFAALVFLGRYIWRQVQTKRAARIVLNTH